MPIFLTDRINVVFSKPTIKNNSYDNTDQHGY